MSYTIFKRKWWKDNPKFPDGLEPHLGRKTIVRSNVPTEDEARRLCREFNENNDPGRHSLKYEYEGGD